MSSLTLFYFKSAVLLLLACFIIRNLNAHSLMNMIKCKCDKTEFCKCCVDFRNFPIPIPHEACLLNKQNKSMSMSIDGKITLDSEKYKKPKEQCLWIRFGTNICITVDSLAFDKKSKSVKGCGFGELKFLRKTVFKWARICLTFGEEFYVLVNKTDAIINKVIQLFDQNNNTVHIL